MTTQLPTIVLDAGVYWLGGERIQPDDLVAAAGDRWNAPGEPAAYLAGDMGVALVETGRHIGEQGQAEVRMTAWLIPARLEEVLDLRTPSVRSTLGLEEPYWFLDQARCRTLGRRLRRDGIGAFLAPSAGFPDDPARWNLVLLDVHDALLAGLTERAHVIGRLMIAPV